MHDIDVCMHMDRVNKTKTHTMCENKIVKMHKTNTYTHVQVK